MKTSSAELKRTARENLSGKYGVAMLAMITVSLIPSALLYPFADNASHGGASQKTIYYLASIIITVLQLILTCGQLRLHLNIVKVSAMRLMSDARSLLFLPSLIKPLDASMIRTSVFSRFWRSTIMMVGIPVPKKIFAGSPIMASIWLFSIRFFLISPSSPPRNSTPCT